MKKNTCSHTYADGTNAWYGAPMNPAMYRLCGVCHIEEFQPEYIAAKPKPKRTRKPKIVAAPLIVMPAPSRTTTKLPAGIAVHHGLCGDVLKKLATHSVDALVTDPPSGIAFMGKTWDKDKGGRDEWIATRRDEFAEALRVLKPGAHALVWALPRTSHWTQMALEDAGFVIRDVVHHLFASGYPKSLDLSKAIDKHYGAEREVIGSYRAAVNSGVTGGFIAGSLADETGQTYATITLPATEDAERFTGYGTGLKPAIEHWILCMKPREGSFAENAIAWGTGGLNIDGSRVALVPGEAPLAVQPSGEMGYMNDRNGRPKATLTARRGTLSLVKPSDSDDRESHRTSFFGGMKDGIGAPSDLGRWPSHVVISHSLFCTPEACADGCPAANLNEQGGERPAGKPGVTGHKHQNRAGTVYNKESRQEGTPVMGYGDTGGAARYFNQLWPDAADVFPVGFFPKPGRGEKETGLADMIAKTNAEVTNRVPGSAGLSNPASGMTRTHAKNFHPTVKSTALMRWLITLITPPTRRGEAPPLVLDMFAGSGTTGVACVELGLRAVLIEADMDDEGYIDLIYGRVADAADRRKNKRGILAAEEEIAA